MGEIKVLTKFWLWALQVSLYRMSADHIGCSLAEAAESQSYLNFLQEAAATPKSMHVIYINTSLETKAQAHSRVPTITCTSSNVVQTVLQVWIRYFNYLSCEWCNFHFLMCLFYCIFVSTGGLLVSWSGHQSAEILKLKHLCEYWCLTLFLFVSCAINRGLLKFQIWRYGMVQIHTWVQTLLKCSGKCYLSVMKK